MGCCASALDPWIQDAKEKIEETLLQQKVKGIELDTAILDIKQGCLELKDCIDPIKKRYDLYSHTDKDVIHARMNEEQLQLPSLSVWARESTFLGSANAAAKIQHISGHQFELATLEKAVRHTEVRECAKLLAQAEEVLMSATKICSTYMKSEVKLDDRKKKLETARKKKLDADEASKAADAALEVAKRAKVAAEGEFTPADSAHEEAKRAKLAAEAKKAGVDNSSAAAAEAKAEAESAYDSACAELQKAMDTFYEAQQKKKKAVEAEAKADSVAADKRRRKEAADDAEATAAAACSAAEEEVAQAKADASSEGPLKRKEAEQKVKAAFNALQSGYERFRFGAEGYAANPDKYEAEFALYAPKASDGLLEGALEGITVLLASAMKEGLAAAKLDKEPTAAPVSEDGAPAFGAQAEKVRALKTGCESAARRTASAAKQIKAWSKVGLRSILGPKSHAKLSEEQMVGELVKLLLEDDVKEAVAHLALPGKDAMEEAFAAGACVAIQDATAVLKSVVDAISKEASDWANKLKDAEDARAKIKAKATAAKADEDAGRPEERRRKPADETEVSISKLLDVKVQKDFEALMAKAAVLAGSGEGSVEAIYLTPLQDFMAAQTEFLKARKVVGAFVVPEGLIGLTHESIEEHAPVVQDEQQVLADAATEPEAAPRPSLVKALSKVKSHTKMRSGRLPEDASTSSLSGGSGEDDLEAVVFMALSKKAKRTSAKDLLKLQPERATAYLVDDIEDDPVLVEELNEELNEGDGAAAEEEAGARTAFARFMAASESGAAQKAYDEILAMVGLAGDRTGDRISLAELAPLLLPVLPHRGRQLLRQLRERALHPQYLPRAGTAARGKDLPGSPMHVVIVGGGPVGLRCALELAFLGCDVEVRGLGLPVMASDGL